MSTPKPVITPADLALIPDHLKHMFEVISDQPTAVASESSAASESAASDSAPASDLAPVSESPIVSESRIVSESAHVSESPTHPPPSDDPSPASDVPMNDDPLPRTPPALFAGVDLTTEITPKAYESHRIKVPTTGKFFILGFDL